jgi:anti-sigma factor ChrR (cupin superfamily)
VYPEGLNKDATDDELSISISPSPNYSKLAKAAAAQSDWMQAARVATVKELREKLVEAAEHVQSGRGALVEAITTE